VEETIMAELQRRDFLFGAGALAGVALHHGRALAQIRPASEALIPWIDQPPPVPPAAAGIIRTLTRWEELNTWITPNDKFFSVGHYDWPQIDEKDWRLDVAGLVTKPLSLTLSELKALPRQEITCTIECSGSNGLPFFTSAIGNARWAGTSLANILRAAQIRAGAIEVVFFGTDKGEETLRKGTPLELTFASNFARSMSIDDAMNPANLICYEMNSSPLPAPNGYPVRLIAPGWYGVANVKWLSRIELRDTRFMGRFMGRDYVTVREELRDGKPIVTETSVGRTLLKSAPSRITLGDGRYRIAGMAWGPNAIAAVEIKIDDGPWIKASLEDTDSSEPVWHFWHLDMSLGSGEHAVISRAIDKSGNTQPAMDDPSIVNKKTYWESNGQITRRFRIT
jgi:DMSO/TMAO reductase YedYZ molybdopterin-dependent catalytic subunit